MVKPVYLTLIRRCRRLLTVSRVQSVCESELACYPEKELLQIPLRAPLSPSPGTLFHTHTVVWIYQVARAVWLKVVVLRVSCVLRKARNDPLVKKVVVDLSSGSLPPMASLDFGTRNLSSDNFDMANLDFPSLSFSVDHDDLNLMARMGSLFDLHVKDASTHNGQTSRQPPQCTQGAPHLAAQQPMQFEPASFSPASSPEFACLSQPVVSQQKQPQQVSGQQSLMPSFPQAFVSTPPASQVLLQLLAYFCMLYYLTISTNINSTLGLCSH